ncbi:MAG TPA: PDZ domain-containing protein [Caldithrix abyssi]|uniref:PDZ domain-containing protein n=1 Tax=Caldithrix abyssi TaxID=187145 RepID=A0A7V5RR36_CALAY|nr:PDZ domain-containing protein [Caldithrix abyssi]
MGLKKAAPLVLPFLILSGLILGLGLGFSARQHKEAAGMPVVVPGGHLYTESVYRAPDSAAAPAFANPNRMFVKISKKLRPSIVTVYTSKAVSQSELFGDNLPDDETHRRPFKSRGLGSGIVIREDGYLLTNNHVIADMDEITVRLLDQREFRARIVGSDPKTDVALLKIAARGLRPAVLGDSDQLEIGEWVMAIGSPLNLQSTVTAGIISAISRNMNILDNSSGDAIQNFIQTDAAVNPGNSGGALVNLKGEVIGINTAIATRSNYYMGYSFAIPINIAKKIVDDLTRFGEIRRGYLGVYIRAVDAAAARGVGLDKPRGVLIYSVQPGRAAEKAGLKSGDVILSVNGTPVNLPNELQAAIGTKRPGDRVHIVYWRDGREESMYVVLFDKDGALPRNVSRRPVMEPDKLDMERPLGHLGLRFSPLSGGEQQRLGLKGGVRIDEVEDFSTAAEKGLMAGDIILEIDGVFPRSPDEAQKLVERHGHGDVISFRLLSPADDEEDFERVLFIEIP